MTTTLRPSEPLQQSADGGRSRTYEICVNSRRVGSVHLTTDAAFGGAVGVIEDLVVDEPDRGRGRGTVAALASEEVLRGWGCGEVRISVPTESAPGLRMAEALGYAERSRNMVKELAAGPPELPEGFGFRPVTEEEFAQWSARSLDAFAQSWIDRGMPEELARAKAEDSRRRFLPQGLATPGISVVVALRDAEVVGYLWTGGLELEPGERSGFVFEVEVAEEQRGKGYGRGLMLLAERLSLAAGESLLGLHVFAGNTPAIRLYESLGYRTTHLNSAKTLR
ncbi:MULTISPECIES: GNAT family N-acetyltransferase [unclassified Streptomyces]|uniref:GNAT family N-acetyltransferase n=1 Tax=unclassified Streptomyces TaxID=2593676 RepID=UPI002E2FB6F4|nr:GNAT family N-acetyltransferase [Streptomyces sp. NBC_01268]